MTATHTHTPHSSISLPHVDRLARALARAHESCPVIRESEAGQPRRAGGSAHYETLDGTWISYPRAYKRVGWSNMRYVSSSLRVEVSQSWYDRVAEWSRDLPAWARRSIAVIWDDRHQPVVRRVGRRHEVQIGPWVYRRAQDGSGVESDYVPYGDSRDLDEWRDQANQERRRMILRHCGDRLEELLEARTVQLDDYGRLCDTVCGRAVRVVCPSTGSVYWIPVHPRTETAHEAVASTFELSVEDYSPTAQA